MYFLPVILSVLCSTVQSRFLNKETVPYTVCQSPACYDIAEEIESNMNVSVNPCEDFFHFACGKWVWRQIGKQYARNFEAPDGVVKRRTKDILEDDYGGHYPPLMREAITYYNQCKYFSEANSTITQQIYKYINETKLSRFGGWPIVTPTWDESQFNFKDALVFMHRYFWFNGIYETRLVFPEKRGQKGKILLGVEDVNGEFGRVLNTNDTEALPIKALLVMNKFGIELTSLIEKFHKGNMTESMNQQVSDIQNFAFDLVNITKRFVDVRVGTGYTLAEIGQRLNNTFWYDFYVKVLGSSKVDQNQKVFVNIEELLEVQSLLQQTKKRTIANYLVWRFLTGYTARFKECQENTQKAFIHAIGSVYVKRYLDDNVLNDITHIVNNIRGALDQLLDSASWMDETTKARAKKKLRFLKTHIGYPKMYKNMRQLRMYHQGLSIKKGYHVLTFMNNVDETFRFDTRAYKINWAIPRFHFLFSEGAIDANAAYMTIANSLAVFAGILVEPLYNPMRPMSMNYGSIGYIIGHEFTHAFDSKGKDFDEFGNEQNWWSNYSTKGYEDRYQCFLHQYSALAENSTNATEYSKYTAGENIADSGGVREAYMVLKNHLKKKPEFHQRLPGAMSRFTPEQLFFLSHANTYCAYIPNFMQTIMKYTDVHSVDGVRVIGNIMNSVDFGDAFKCPKGSPMNPVKKCSLF